MTKPVPSAPNAHATTADFEFAALGEARNYRAALLTSFKPHLIGNVLEVGAGVGQFTRELKQVPTIKELVAVEPDPRFHEGLCDAVGETHVVRGLAGDVDTGRAWDAVVSVNVLEHIEHDQHELQRYRELLGKAGGTLCLFVPARPELYSPLDRDFGHFRRYTRPDLRQKLEAAGFQITELRYFNGLGYFAWWLSFCFLRRRSFNVFAVQFYDRVLFPAVFWLERHLAAPPFGQSLMAIARAGSSGLPKAAPGATRI